MVKRELAMLITGAVSFVAGKLFDDGIDVAAMLEREGTSGAVTAYGIVGALVAAAETVDTVEEGAAMVGGDL